MMKHISHNDYCMALREARAICDQEVGFRDTPSYLEAFKIILVHKLNLKSRTRAAEDLDQVRDKLT